MSSQWPRSIAHADNGLLNALVNNYRRVDNTWRERTQLHVARLMRTKTNGSDTKAPLVTAYVPTHNRVELLMDRALPSIRDQTYDNLEIIIVADRCSDTTARAVRGLKDPRIRVVELNNYVPPYPSTTRNIWFCGSSVAANAALRIATGVWIARIDDDDEWFPSHIHDSLKFAVKTGAEFVSSSYETQVNGVKLIRRGDVWGSSRIGGIQTWLYRDYLKLFRYSNNCWRKRSERVNDLDLQVRMLRAGVRMDFLDKVSAKVLPRPGNETVGLEQYLADEDSIAQWFGG